MQEYIFSQEYFRGAAGGEGPLREGARGGAGAGAGAVVPGIRVPLVEIIGGCLRWR